MIDKEREVKGRAKEHEDGLEKQKTIEESAKCKYSAADEAGFMRKLRQAAQDYAVDSAALQEPLQAFKGPALSPLAFREIFGRIFGTKNKPTFPEMGVLLSILDNAGTGTLDGPRFLNWFYKLGRIEGRIMLGESPDDVTLQGLRASASHAYAAALAAAQGAAQGGGGGPKDALEVFNSKPQKKFGHRGGGGGGEDPQEEDVSEFTRQTLNQSWILPSATGVEGTADGHDVEALQDTFAPLNPLKKKSSAQPRAEEDLEGEMRAYNAALGDSKATGKATGKAPPSKGTKGNKDRRGSEDDQSGPPGESSQPGRTIVVRDDMDGAGASKGKKKGSFSASPAGFYFPSLLQTSSSSPLYNVAPSGMRDLF